MKVIAIIPARGGSKGIPHKNLKLLAGKPLLSYSILHAKATRDITRVVVSTDDTDIATMAHEYGSEVVIRPSNISGDSASSESALLHTLDFLKNTEAYEPEFVVFLQATSPLRQSGEVQAALDRVVRDGADSLLSVSSVHGFIWRLEEDGTPRSLSYDYSDRPRRQDSPEDLLENGSIYILKPWVLRTFNNRLGGKIVFHRMSALDSFQIDEPGDFEVLESLMRHRCIPAEAGQSSSRFGITNVCSSAGSFSSGVGFRPSGAELRKIKLLVLDFDGVLTDNRVLVSEDGRESVFCDRGDGLGLEMLSRSGLDVVVLSKEKNSVVTARCRKLGVQCIQACDEKLFSLQKIAKNKGLEAGQVAYVGNDVNDLECMRWVGLPIAVADGLEQAKQMAKWVTVRAGGRGAVRDICDLLLSATAQREP